MGGKIAAMKLFTSPEPRQILAERERGTTTIDMPALAAFLRERIAEDLRVRRDAGETGDDPVMKMLTANLGIVTGWSHMATSRQNRYTAQAVQVITHTMRHLIAPYSEHPDCRPEWPLGPWGSL